MCLRVVPHACQEKLCATRCRLLPTSDKVFKNFKVRRKKCYGQLRLRDRIRNLIDEVHKQLAVHLGRSYDLVMIPKFEVSQMIRKVGRKIGAKTARQMATWAHDRFRQRLTFKCRQFGCKVAIVNEAYTSKTCSCCGNVKYNLGGAKVYKCRACGAVILMSGEYSTFSKVTGTNLPVGISYDGTNFTSECALYWCVVSSFH